MRIAFILDRLNLGGAERHTLNLSRALAARGHDIRVIVLFRGGSEQFPVADFPVPPVALAAGGLFSDRVIGRLKAALDDFAPQVVFAINQSALVAATLARLRGAAIPRLYCRFATTIIPSLAGRMKLPVFKWATARAEGLIFVSLRQREHWQARGMTSKRVVVIQNGIDTDRFVPATAEARAKMRAHYGLGPGAVSLTLVGRLAPEKNHVWLIETLAALRAEYGARVDPLHLVFIGEGPLRANLEARVAACGLGTRVIFAGGMRDVVPALAQADAGILVSNAVETFSHAAIEQMSCALPVILTDIGGASEIVVDGAQGFLVPLRDQAKLGRAMLAMLDPALRRRMGQAARARVLDHFTAEHMVDLYEAVATGQPRSGIS